MVGLVRLPGCGFRFEGNQCELVTPSPYGLMVPVRLYDSYILQYAQKAPAFLHTVDG